MKVKPAYDIISEPDGTAFIRRVLGNETVLSRSHKDQLGAGTELFIYQVIPDTLPSNPDDKTFLNFYPVEDGKFYLQLTFFPERNLRDPDAEFIIHQLLFLPEFFNQWPGPLMQQVQPFQFDRSVEQAFNLPACCFEPIHSLAANKSAIDKFSEALKRQESAFFLLRQSLQAFQHPDEASKLPACSFLSNSRERDKVVEAQQLILKNLATPMTIRELARQVGINECYLKKGFKATFGKTIHEFQQMKRIEKSKEILREGKHSINEVAYMMGFGSASHFSSSFKKIAGIKPCELLG